MRQCRTLAVLLLPVILSLDNSEMFDQILSLLCGYHSIARSGKQAKAQLFFELFDRVAEAWLGNIEVSGSLAERPCVDKLDDLPELFQPHSDLQIK